MTGAHLVTLPSPSHIGAVHLGTDLGAVPSARGHLCATQCRWAEGIRLLHRLCTSESYEMQVLTRSAGPKDCAPALRKPNRDPAGRKTPTHQAAVFSEEAPTLQELQCKRTGTKRREILARGPCQMVKTPVMRAGVDAGHIYARVAMQGTRQAALGLHEAPTPSGTSRAGNVNWMLGIAMQCETEKCGLGWRYYDAFIVMQYFPQQRASRRLYQLLGTKTIKFADLENILSSLLATAGCRPLPLAGRPATNQRRRRVRKGEVGVGQLKTLQNLRLHCPAGHMTGDLPA